MNKIIRAALTLAFILLLFSGCSRDPAGPERGVQYIINFEYVDVPQGEILGKAPAGLRSAKAFSTASIDLARVMVIDFAAYLSWNAAIETPEWSDYSQDRDSWEGDLSRWGEWEKLIGNHFKIVSNQILPMIDGMAEGNVAGAVGLNRIVVAFLEENVLRYWGEAAVVGVEGSTVEVNVQVHEQYNY